MQIARFSVLLISILMGTMAIAHAATDGHEDHHPGGDQPSAAAPARQGMMGMPGMMHQGKGMMSEGMPCMMGSGRPMMGMGSGMMPQPLEQMFFLDRADALELTPEQQSRLKLIRFALRKDNIRSGAEAKIARLELAELLGTGNWSLQDAEPLVRRVQQLQGDIQLRRLQALIDARTVLTPAQLEKARASEQPGNLESLFQ